jgi:hypothetical protein
MDPNVLSPSTVKVPVVLILSSPKLKAPVESVIEPLAAVKVLLIAIEVAVVDRFSLPKLIVPDESFIIPFKKSKFPNCEPVAADSVPVVVKFSFPKLIDPPK